MSYATGSLVRARGRDWVVLPPESRPESRGAGDWLRLKPLGGTNEEIITILPMLELEDVRPAVFAVPDPAKCGDARSCALLRDAVRLGLRATTGPFRCFGHIAVDPRPYQFVPLLMAMKQPVVRLLIADDVGIGKTVEALLIARELLDRGEIRRMSVLCPPQLAEQWQHELEEKFHIEAQLVLPSTIARLERGLDAATSIFEAWPFTVVSLDYIKSDRHRQEFLRACPEMVIVDEAHACASASGNRSGKQRYELVRELAEDSNRHMIFVTATPHSGKEDVFRSLLAFLNPDFSKLSDNLSGREHEEDRRKLAEHFLRLPDLLCGRGGRPGSSASSGGQLWPCFAPYLPALPLRRQPCAPALWEMVWKVRRKIPNSWTRWGQGRFLIWTAGMTAPCLMNCPEPMIRKTANRMFGKTKRNQTPLLTRPGPNGAGHLPGLPTWRKA